jgi:transcriptional regulator with XRE-family HTH domain
MYRVPGKYIAAARAILGLSQAEFADLCAVSFSSIRLIESDNPNMRDSTIGLVMGNLALSGITFNIHETMVIICHAPKA